MSSDHQKKTEFTKKVSPNSFIRAFPTPQRPANADEAPQFQTVPADAKPLAGKRWRIVLSPVERPLEQLALELAGDVVFGSSADPEVEMDVNLSVWNGAERGVSHRHALMRPAASKLYLLDLGSTNGTHYNGALLTRDRVQALAQGDLITFGRLHLRVKQIMQIELPAPEDAKTLRDSQPTKSKKS